MSQKPPLLQQVDVKNGVPGAAAINQTGPAARGSNGASSAPHNDGPAAAEATGAPAAATPEIYEMLAELRRDIDARRKIEASGQPAAPDGELQTMMSELRRDMSVLKRSPVTIRSTGSARPIGTGAIPPSAIPAVIPGMPANIVYVETAKPSILRRLMSEEMRPALSLATALFIAVSGLYLITNRGALAPVGSQSAVASTSGSTAAGALAGGGATPLYDALAAGSTSPQGVSAKGVTATRALARANAQLLVAGSSRDTQEAAFWLKRYMSDTMGDVRMARALTQLGATYAEQTGKGADYTKARQVWEMAGALGDPVAMCFLGRLFENGWSVAANSKTALQWYERARDAGGCPAIEESIARVQ